MLAPWAGLVGADPSNGDKGTTFFRNRNTFRMEQAEDRREFCGVFNYQRHCVELIKVRWQAGGLVMFPQQFDMLW